MSPGVLLQECGQRLLGLRPNGGREARRHNVEHRDTGAVPPGQRVREAECQLGVRATPNGNQDPVDLGDRALLDDRDVAGGFAYDRIDGRAEDERRLVRGIGGAGSAAGRSARTTRTARGPASRPAAPAEDHEVGLELDGGLHDPLGRPAPDPDHGPDMGSFRRVVEHLLEQAARLARLRGAFGEGHLLRDLHDAQCRQLTRPRVQERRADADQLLRRGRVGHRDQDPAGQRRTRGHDAPPAGRACWAAFQRSMRYGLRSSKARAWRSTRSSASAWSRCRVSTIRLPTRPK